MVANLFSKALARSTWRPFCRRLIDSRLRGAWSKRLRFSAWSMALAEVPRSYSRCWQRDGQVVGDLPATDTILVGLQVGNILDALECELLEVEAV